MLIIISHAGVGVACLRLEYRNFMVFLNPGVEQDNHSMAYSTCIGVGPLVAGSLGPKVLW